MMYFVINLFFNMYLDKYSSSTSSKINKIIFFVKISLIGILDKLSELSNTIILHLESVVVELKLCSFNNFCLKSFFSSKKKVSY